MRIFISLIPFLPVKLIDLFCRLIFGFLKWLTWMTFLVSSNCRLDLTTGSTWRDRSSRRVIWLSNARYLLSKSSQCCANVDNTSRRFSKLFSKSDQFLLISVFCCSIFDRLTGSAWRKISRAFSFSKSSSPWCDYMREIKSKNNFFLIRLIFRRQ